MSEPKRYDYGMPDSEQLAPREGNIRPVYVKRRRLTKVDRLRAYAKRLDDRKRAYEQARGARRYCRRT